ncbi:MAG: hypothetical protein AAFO94_19655 [Bacteroidota bacterium]
MQNKRGTRWAWIVLMAGLCLQLGSCASLRAQNSDEQRTTPLFTLPVKAVQFAADKLGQSYALIEPNELIQYSNTGKEFFRYNNNYLGPLHLIDPTDPFNLLLFYKDFSTIITLDRTLTQTGEVNLLDLDIVDVDAVGVSNDNNIWLYDETAFRLKKISRSGDVIYESDPLSLIFDEPLDINFLLERNNQVFLNDPQQGVYVFDLFGRYLRKIDLRGLDRFQILGQQLIFRKDNKLNSYHLKTLAEAPINLPVPLHESQKIYLQKDRFFLIGPEQIAAYRFP